MKPAPLMLYAAMHLACAPAGANPTTSRIPVAELKPLLKLAIERGEAHGVLTGEAAAYMKQKFGSAAAIEIDVRTLHPLPQPGCSRLEVRTRQAHVQEKASREDKSDRKSTRLNSSHIPLSRMPSSA